MSPESDIRDRLARAEQDIKNHKENFANFKSDDFGSLKREVHSMRTEINDKVDKLLENIAEMREKQDERWSALQVRLAYYMGGFAVVMFFAKVAIDKFF